MRYVNVENRFLLSLPVLAVFIWAVVGTTVGAIASGSGSVISAQVCDNAGSTITIAKPKNDSIVNQSSVRMQGNVTHATQITVMIDGQYNQTIPLGTNQSTYSFDVSLTAGTHTIKVEANDVCAASNGTAQVVITFESKANGSAGNEIPTSAGGVVVGAGTAIDIPEQNVYQRLRGSAVVGPVLGGIEKAFRFTGLDKTVERDGVVTTVVRVGMFTVGMTTLTFTTLAAQTYAAVPAQWLGKILPPDPIVGHRYLMLSLRGSSLLLILVAAVL